MKLPILVAGVDEVGRGCLAGPVYAGAVAFRSSIGVESFRDSKSLTAKQRENLALVIRQNHYVGIGSANVGEVDQFNILQASFLAMRRALENLILRCGLELKHVLVDGHMKIPGMKIQQTAVIGGDASEPVIGAASIVAKVERDQLMTKMAERFPNYGFEKHKGYGTQEHLKQIQKFGPTEIHRRTFKGVREHLA